MAGEKSNIKFKKIAPVVKTQRHYFPGEGGPMLRALALKKQADAVKPKNTNNIAKPVPPPVKKITKPEVKPQVVSKPPITNTIYSGTINICIIHYNTPELTKCLVKSINKFVDKAKIFIFDNSDSAPFTYRQENIEYFDNTKGQIIDFPKWLDSFSERKYSAEATKTGGSAKHCYSVEKCIELIGDNFILMDSDILLIRPINDLWDTNFLAVGEAIPQWNRSLRLAPFICFLNVKKMKENGVHYFDANHMHGLWKSKEQDGYDTGRWFYEKAKGNTKWIKMKDYIIHYGGGSWEELHNNRPILMNNIGERSKLLKGSEWIQAHKDLWVEAPEGEKLIVSMTSWSKRLNNIPTVLGTILSGIRKPDKIVINLAIEEFREKEQSLPSNLLTFITENKIEINWVEKNIRQWKKTIPTMLKYPKDCVVCIDDDRKYPADFLSSLWAEHLKHPNNPITTNSGYKYKGKYLQHAGHGTLDKLGFYNGFKGVLSDELYKMASSDTFFTLIANNSGHPLRFVGKRLAISMYNETNPLSKSEGTYGMQSHDAMYRYLKGKGYIPNIK